jgi:hypothetical protein
MTKYRSLRHPCVPAYARVLDRLESFKEAPENLQRMLPAIAEAGFFYQGHGDAVCCFHCSISIIEWEKWDDPWIEHAYWSPHCPYVLGMKNMKWVRQVFNARARLADSDRDWGDLPLDDAGNPHCTQKCCICDEQELRIAFLPCGHLCCCAMCGAGLQYCPICRQSVEETVRIFTC